MLQQSLKLSFLAQQLPRWACMALLASYLIVSLVFHTSSDAGLPFSKQAKLCFSSEDAEVEACLVKCGPSMGRQPGSEGGRLWQVGIQHCPALGRVRGWAVLGLSVPERLQWKAAPGTEKSAGDRRGVPGGLGGL